MREGTGKHRTRGQAGRSDTAFVKDRSISFDIEEKLYRERGYAPSFDMLPWAEADAPREAAPVRRR